MRLNHNKILTIHFITIIISEWCFSLVYLTKLYTKCYIFSRNGKLPSNENFYLSFPITPFVKSIVGLETNRVSRRCVIKEALTLMAANLTCSLWFAVTLLLFFRVKYITAFPHLKMALLHNVIRIKTHWLIFSSTTRKFLHVCCATLDFEMFGVTMCTWCQNHKSILQHSATGTLSFSNTFGLWNEDCCSLPCRKAHFKKLFLRFSWAGYL